MQKCRSLSVSLSVSLFTLIGSPVSLLCDLLYVGIHTFALYLCTVCRSGVDYYIEQFRETSSAMNIRYEYSFFFHLFCKFLMFTLFGSAKWMSVFTSRQWLEGTKDKNNNVALESILYQMIGRQSKNWLRSWRIVKESEREGLVQWGREREKDRERERERQVCKARAAIFARRWFLYLFIMQLMSVQ